MRKQTMWFLNRSDTNRTVQPKKMARSLKKLFSEFMILSRGTRKPTFCNCENKSADRLRSNRKVDQRLCFCYTDSTIPLLKSQISCFCDCTGWFASVLLVGFLMPQLISSLPVTFSQREAIQLPTFAIYNHW